VQRPSRPDLTIQIPAASFGSTVRRDILRVDSPSTSPNPVTAPNQPETSYSTPLIENLPATPPSVYINDRYPFDHLPGYVINPSHVSSSDIPAPRPTWQRSTSRASTTSLRPASESTAVSFTSISTNPSPPILYVSVNPNTNIRTIRRVEPFIRTANATTPNTLSVLPRSTPSPSPEPQNSGANRLSSTRALYEATSAHTSTGVTNQEGFTWNRTQTEDEPTQPSGSNQPSSSNSGIPSPPSPEPPLRLDQFISIEEIKTLKTNQEIHILYVVSRHGIIHETYNLRQVQFASTTNRGDVLIAWLEENED